MPISKASRLGLQQVLVSGVWMENLGIGLAYVS